jgi:hypothetical protein
VSNAWYGTTVPAANTPATTGEFCRIPPGYMNEHKDNPTGNGEDKNSDGKRDVKIDDKVQGQLG